MAIVSGLVRKRSKSAFIPVEDIQQLKFVEVVHDTPPVQIEPVGDDDKKSEMFGATNLFSAFSQKDEEGKRDTQNLRGMFGEDIKLFPDEKERIKIPLNSVGLRKLSSRQSLRDETNLRSAVSLTSSKSSESEKG